MTWGKPQPCGHDKDLGQFIHRFDPGTNVCRCGKLTVALPEKPTFNNQRGRRKKKPKPKTKDESFNFERDNKEAFDFE